MKSFCKKLSKFVCPVHVNPVEEMRKKDTVYHMWWCL